MPGQGAGAAETVLQEPDPGHVGLVGGAVGRGVLAGERGEGHPQVAGRQQAQLAAQPAGRAPVVGDGDHRGDPVRDAAVGEHPQRGQRGVQAVAAAEGDGREPVAGRCCCHSRPRSRWVTRTAMPSTSASRRPISSLIATLRCLPPVQPTARVR